MTSYSSVGDPDRVPFTSFDVAEYTRRAGGRIVVDADQVAREYPAGFDDRTRADLAFCHRLEAGVLDELRALLATSTSTEARITAFCSTWAYQRYWFARAQADLLAAGGHPAPAPVPRFRDRMRSLYVEHALPIVAPLWSGFCSRPATAAQMTELALQEAGLRQAHLTLVARLRGHARAVLTEIVHQREEIVSFFTEEARMRSARTSVEAGAVRKVIHRPGSAMRIVGIPDPDERRSLLSLHVVPRPSVLSAGRPLGL